MSQNCHHCKLTFSDAGIPLDDSAQAPRFCCPACRLVFLHINEHGLSEYYQRRSVLPGRPGEEAPDYRFFDDENYLQEHYRSDSKFNGSKLNSSDLNGSDLNYSALSSSEYAGRFWIDGLHCSACAWLIESRLRQMEGVLSANVSYNERTLSIEWLQEKTRVSEILTALFELGYQGVEWSPELKQQRLLDEKKYIQQRMGVAGLLMMQVGMLSLGLYAGEWQGMESGIRDLLRAASGGLAAICLLYCGKPFISSALIRLRQRSVNVDVPIALALVLTWCGSVYATIAGHDAVYFDTVTMFVFFLLVSRFIEASSRSAGQIEQRQTIPATADRMRAPGINSSTDRVPTISLQPGDRILCRAGQTLAVDGKVIAGCSGVNESLFTGESDLQQRGKGDLVFAATVNVDQPLEVEVTATGKNCALYQLEALAYSLETQKPAYARLIDRLSPWFVLVVIGIATLTALYWLFNDSSNIITASIAVLVAACPCALSLSTPTAYATTNTRLKSLGVAIRSAATLETLPAITHAVFDKTGTLSNDKMELQNIEVMQGRTQVMQGSAEDALQLAASLENYASHPIANSLTAANQQPLLAVESATNVVGKGVEGFVNGNCYRIGRASWSTEIIDDTKSDNLDEGYDNCSVNDNVKDKGIVLACETGIVAQFEFREILREGATELIAALRQLGLSVSILSGDSYSRVATMAQRLGVDEFHTEQTPENKLTAIQQLRNRGEKVLMVGDGLNDIPVLAAADASVAVANASSLSKNHADAVLLGNNLMALLTLLQAATRNRKTIRQNISWAVSYNALVMPLAAMAYLPPWLAALGMSLSSIIVVMNSRHSTRNMLSTLANNDAQPTVKQSITSLAYKG